MLEKPVVSSIAVGPQIPRFNPFNSSDTSGEAAILASSETRKPVLSHRARIPNIQSGTSTYIEILGTGTPNSTGISVDTTGSTLDEHHLQPEDLLRRRLQYFFMNPCQKFRAKRKFPVKLTLQLFMVSLVTAQVRIILK